MRESLSKPEDCAQCSNKVDSSSSPVETSENRREEAEGINGRIDSPTTVEKLFRFVRISSTINIPFERQPTIDNLPAMDGEDPKFAIHAACREGKTIVVESLLNANPKLAALVDDDGRQPIHWACAYNHLPIIRILMNHPRPSFDPDVVDSSGWTPLMIASSLPNEDGIECVKLLLSKDADPNLKTNGGQTALHFATSKQNLDICRTLLNHKASARTKDKRGQLPSHRAAAVGNVPILKLLLKEGRSPLDATDIDGMTALHHAISEGHGDAAIELIKAGIDVTKRDVEDHLAIELAPDTKVRKYIIYEAEKEGIDLV